MGKIIDVAAAVIKENGLIIMARRAKGEHLAGKWEFPGGKIESHETPEQCLQRELKEEFAIITRTDAFVGESIFNYPDKPIRLLAYEVVWLGGDFMLHVHDKIDWVRPEDILAKEMAAADMPIARMLCDRNP